MGEYLRVDTRQYGSFKGFDQCQKVPVVLAQELLDIAHKLDEGESLELTQDNGNKGEVQHKAIALLKEAITPKAKAGSYAANNATGMRRLVEQALAVLTGTES